MSDEFVENMEEYFGVRMDMDGLRIGNEHSGDSENKRTEINTKHDRKKKKIHRVLASSQQKNNLSHERMAGSERVEENTDGDCPADKLENATTTGDSIPTSSSSITSSSSTDENEELTPLVAESWENQNQRHTVRKRL
ncbi:Hypothetical predicted protein [Octopus vulgaris]|uniref:Uncharacterized protein n=1 Tax=Octopus vulgaris TaxID=6645 RepID=A0AA36BNV4_OCTVU|nr:Hypothetical predicted protein [Octopus vulgaris]